MSLLRHRFVALMGCFLLAGCPSESEDFDGGSLDGGGPPDGGRDAGEADGGGGDDGGRDAGGGDGGGVCPVVSAETTSDGFPVTVCMERHSSPPYVRLPADATDGGTRFVYGGIERMEASLIFKARGAQFTVTGSPAWLTREKDPARYGYVLYRARVVGSQVEEVTPVVRVHDLVFQRLLAGTALEGPASARLADGGFRWDNKDVQVRLQLDADPQTTPHDQIHGFPRFALLGTLQNVSTGARSFDGGCLPSLQSRGAANPVLTADGGARVKVLRHPNMHGGMDDVFTLDWPEGTVPTGNNMGGGLFISAASLIQDVAPALRSGHSSPHGVPWGGPSADLHVVPAGGGAACTP